LLARDPFQHIAGQVMQALCDVVATLQAAGVLVGIHCCAGQPPFQIMCQAAPDILSFDAYQALEICCADSFVRRFVHDGGLVAYGLIPTCSDLSDLDSTKRESISLESSTPRASVLQRCRMGSGPSVATPSVVLPPMSKMACLTSSPS